MGFHGTKKVGKRVRALARGSGFRFHFNPSRFNAPIGLGQRLPASKGLFSHLVFKPTAAKKIFRRKIFGPEPAHGGLKSFAFFLNHPLITPLRALFADDQAKNARKGVMSGLLWVRSKANHFNWFKSG